VRLFRVAVSTNRTDLVVTNDMAQKSTQDVQDACALRWEVELFHREIKQLTALKSVSVERLVSKRTTLPVPCWCGWRWPRLPGKRVQLCIKSRKACYQTTWDRNSEVRPSEWLLR